jgi:hypothetical protein
MTLSPRPFAQTCRVFGLHPYPGAFVLLLLLPLLYLPKLNLFSLPGEYAGLRYDDAALFVALLLIVSGWLKRLEIPPMPACLYWLGFFTLFGLASALLNNTGLIGILYSIRLAEYGVFFFAGALLSGRPLLFGAYLAGYALLNMALVPLQLEGLVPAFTSQDGMVMGIPVGLTGGTWELGLVLVLLCAALVLTRVHWAVQVLGLLLSAITLQFVAARIPFVLLILLSSVLVLRLMLWLDWRWRITAALTLALLGLLVANNVSGTPLGDRLSSLTSGDNAVAVRVLFRLADTSQGVRDINANVIYGLLPNTDNSLLRRAEKTALAWRQVQQSWPGLEAWIGHAPGSRGPAVDMAYMRLLVEYGVLGTIAFFAFLFTAARIHPAMALCTFLLLLNMLTLDAYMTYKVMSVYFLLAGFFWANAQSPKARRGGF